MNHQSTARIISWNVENLALCASAAKISSTPGNADEIFLTTMDRENNADLIAKVLRSGHKSVIEHACFSIAFQDVSAYVEQFLIECRLASFTVKSRRYVDFSNQGYFVPEDLSETGKQGYRKYMDILFDGYKTLVQLGTPKEDARFILPYSFCSNLYCTVNARELASMIAAMKHGRGKHCPELCRLAEDLTDQWMELFPVDLSVLLSGEDEDLQKETASTNAGEPIVWIEPGKTGQVELLQAPSEPEIILRQAMTLNRRKDAGNCPIHELITLSRPRELEQLSYTIKISNITLSGITHLVRHRMQSVIIPPIDSVSHNRVILPDTITQHPEAERCYKNTVSRANDLAGELFKSEELRNVSYYFALSGNVMDVMTTMNARELLLFVSLRACNRAQWEIREITMDMLRCLKNDFPDLFCYYGPSCVVTGRCPEGRLSCGKIKQVQEHFMNWRRE